MTNSNSRSPWKESGYDAHNVTQNVSPTKKVKHYAYPNDLFKDVAEYVDYARENNVYGAAAYQKRKAEDKARLPLPVLKPPKEKK